MRILKVELLSTQSWVDFVGKIWQGSKVRNVQESLERNVIILYHGVGHHMVILLADSLWSGTQITTYLAC